MTMTREEAIRRIKAWNLDSDDMEVLAVIIPELAESEDERALRIIRKRMCYDPVPISDEDRRIVENWLEKQKDINCLACDQHLKGYLAGRKVTEDEKQKEQKPAEWSEEDEKLFWGLTAYVPNEELERLGVTRADILKKLKSIRHQPIQIKEAYKEGFQTARHATALAFMNYCDKIRPNGKMCLSNGECEEIEKAFLVGDWNKIERYFHKCQWKPSEEDLMMLEHIIGQYETGNKNSKVMGYLPRIEELDFLKKVFAIWKS